MLDINLGLSLGDCNGTGQQHSERTGYVWSIGNYVWGVPGLMLGVAARPAGN